MFSSFRGKLSLRFQVSATDGLRRLAFFDLANPSVPNRKFPQFQQNEIFELSNAFRNLDVDDKGYVDEATAIKATQASERQPYDVVRQALKEVELDSSRRVELEDYVGVCSLQILPLSRVFP
jgi:hypothetical protein